MQISINNFLEKSLKIAREGSLMETQEKFPKKPPMESNEKSFKKSRRNTWKKCRKKFREKSAKKSPVEINDEEYRKEPRKKSLKGISGKPSKRIPK